MAENDMPMGMYICKHTADACFNVPITACSVSILIEAGLQSHRIRGNPCWLLYIIQINLTLLWVEPQMICLVKQLRHNMHMYSMLRRLSLVS